MGAVILAAGRGERLAGIAAPYMKPALLVNGRPLIVQQVQNALEVTDSITLVLAPKNAQTMLELVSDAMQELNWRHIDVIVQPFASGVVDALKRGLRMYEWDTLVLMGDNVVPPGTVTAMWEQYVSSDPKPDIVVCTAEMPYHDAQRFTYLDNRHWYEKEEVSNPLPTVPVWVGPVIIKSASEMYAALGSNESVGRTFNAFTNVWTYTGHCTDIGVPEALQ